MPTPLTLAARRAERSVRVALVPHTSRSRHHVILFTGGTGLWVLALVGVLVARQAGAEVGDWPWVCLVGVALGGIAIVYARRSWRAR